MICHRFREFTGSKCLMLFSFVLVLAAAGCASSFHETHFFKFKSESAGIPNYFRLMVSGDTLLCSARYISGYFDEDIVNQYFNEIGQPDKGRLIPVGQSPKTEGNKSSEGEVSPTTSSIAFQELKNPALVLLLSSNSDDIANQFGALAQSEEFTTSLARLVASSRFEAAEEAERRLRNDQARGRLVATLGDQLLITLPDNPTAEEVKTRLLEFVNQLGADLGARVPFKNLNEAAEWLAYHRANLRQEARP